MGRFETSGDHPNRWHQPVRVPTGREDIFGAAKEMVEDLGGWEIQSADEETLTITCRRRNGLLGGTSRIVVRVTGPEGIPSSETHCSSESQGALISRDRSNVAEFVRKFWMRVN